MPPKDGESWETWAARMEWTQKLHENAVSKVPMLEVKVSSIEVRMEKIEPVLAGMNEKLDSLLDDKITREAVSRERRTRKMDLKDWLLVGVGVATLFASLPAMIQTVKALTAGV